jgi:hypothetical protein
LNNKKSVLHAILWKRQSMRSTLFYMITTYRSGTDVSEYRPP